MASKRKTGLLVLAWLGTGLYAAGRINADLCQFAGVNYLDDQERFSLIWGIAGGPISLLVSEMMVGDRGWIIRGHGHLNQRGEKQLLEECTQWHPEQDCIERGYGPLLEIAKQHERLTAREKGGA